jgi:hypothetical protein
VSSLVARGVKSDVEITAVEAKESGFTYAVIFEAVESVDSYGRYLTSLCVHEGYFDSSKKRTCVVHSLGADKNCNACYMDAQFPQTLLIALSAGKVAGFLVTRKLQGEFPFKDVDQSQVECVDLIHVVDKSQFECDDAIKVNGKRNDITTKLVLEAARRTASLGKRYLAFKFRVLDHCSSPIVFYNALQSRCKVPCREHRDIVEGEGTIYRLFDVTSLQTIS